MFANAVVDSCFACIIKIMFSLMCRLNTSTNIIIIVQSTLNSDVYTTSELYQIWYLMPIFFIFSIDRM